MIFCNLWDVWVIAHHERRSDKTPRVRTEGCGGKLPSWTGRAAINLSLECLQKMEDKMNSGERQSCQNQPRTINPAHSKPGLCHKQIKMWQKKALYQISIWGSESWNRFISGLIKRLSVSSVSITDHEVSASLTYDHLARPPSIQGLTMIKAYHWFILSFICLLIGCCDPLSVSSAW